MKYTVKIGDHIYKVEIDDLKSRPVVAFVDGVRFEVMPEDAAATLEDQASLPVNSSLAASPTPVPATGVVPSGGTLNTMSVRAPIPGIILEVSVKPGQSVAYGDVLFVIEAMKMRNSIRASRAGIVGEVLVSTGQTVNHNQELMVFAE